MLQGGCFLLGQLFDLGPAVLEPNLNGSFTHPRDLNGQLRAHLGVGLRVLVKTVHEQLGLRPREPPPLLVRARLLCSHEDACHPSVLFIIIQLSLSFNLRDLRQVRGGQRHSARQRRRGGLPPSATATKMWVAFEGWRCKPSLVVVVVSVASGKNGKRPPARQGLRGHGRRR